MFYKVLPNTTPATTTHPFHLISLIHLLPILHFVHSFSAVLLADPLTHQSMTPPQDLFNPCYFLDLSGWKEGEMETK